MSWLPSWLLGGVDLQAEQARSDALDARIAAANQDLVNRRVWSSAQFDAAQADVAAGNASSGVDNVVNSVDSEFRAGAAEGLHNVLAAPGQVVGAAGSLSGELLWGIIKKIPWWAWLAGLGALFVWMGGLSLLRGRLAR
jgi:hypothetical protein